MYKSFLIYWITDLHYLHQQHIFSCVFLEYWQHWRAFHRIYICKCLSPLVDESSYAWKAKPIFIFHYYFICYDGFLNSPLRSLPCKFATLGTTIGTHLTLVRLLPCVRSSMHGQVGTIFENFPAIFTSVISTSRY